MLALLIAVGSSRASAPDSVWLDHFERCDLPLSLCPDADGDGFGDTPYCIIGCQQPYDFLQVPSGDCNDGDNAIHPNAAESCDYIDNDCDEVVDDGFPTLGQSCGTGQLGVCSSGMQVCREDGTDVRCAALNSPSPEVCDGQDDDCDGAVDEGNPGGGIGCSTGLLGICASGTTSCSGGAIQCVQNQQPLAEVCDGLDNDCDGAVDEGNPNGGQSCSTGEPGVCGSGTTTCSGGMVVCSRNNGPSAETCDGQDNDCDGAVDDGNPGGNLNCNTGMQGVCATGLSACTSGFIVCQQTVFPNQETCDGFDNDCDGTVDDGNPNGGISCSTGQPGVCASGTTACSGGAVVCNRNVNPSGEVCDGLDNDCDGAVDEGNPGGGASCNTGQLGVCAAGTSTCINAMVVCARNVNPSGEVCDGLDNDCDGTADEGGVCP
jgi:hypothetical protein